MKMTLYTVATPIGNMEDMSFRAVRILNGVDLIACEDTRETAKLLQQYYIGEKEMVSYHAQSKDSREDEILQRLRDGASVALISDRGTPGISDPGSRLIRRAVEAGITVVPIPGPTALITALQAGGVDTSSFLYLGFMPHKKGRQTLFTEIAESARTVVFYESPHRILKTLESLQESGKQVVLGRELTKMHEEFLRGTAEELFNDLSGRPSIKGEFVVIVQPNA